MTKETIGEYYPTDDLKPHPKNPRKNEEAVNKVAKSIERFGFGSPIIAREEDKVIIAGHTRWKASKQLSLSKVPVIFMDLSAVDAELLMIADNKLGEKADWDDEKLSELLKELKNEDLNLIGFDNNELSKLLDDMDDSLDDFTEEDLDFTYQILIENLNETSQAELLERFELEGMTCRALTV